MEIKDNKVIRERLAKVRELMKEAGIDIYVVVTGDYHISEYAGDYFKEREHITGFTGSAGTAVITQNEAKLFTDGRYFVQAVRQIEGTGFELMAVGAPGVMNLNEYCTSVAGKDMVMGFDGRTVPAEMGLELSGLMASKGGSCDFDFNAIEKIYENRAAFPHSKAFYLEKKYTGAEIEEKLVHIREMMGRKNADVHIMTTLDDICWTFNIRGRDVECNPVIMAFSAITKDRAYIYADRERFNSDIETIFNEAGVDIRPYEQIYDDIKTFTGRILIDRKRINMRIYESVISNVNAEPVFGDNPAMLLKSVKNETEVSNLRNVHVDDGVAVTKFIFWLKKNVSKGDITEADAASYLDELRSQIDDFIELSFDTISAYNENAAMMHYHADSTNAALLKPEGMLLVDSGGQYLRGTTDITRTIALGPVTDEMRKYFTLTLKGMLNLANARFLKGCTGFNLDILARGPLWDIGMDYRCGTGHGIGYLLNVHESPNGFRWKHNPGHNDLAVIEEGMVTSDEPGVYIEGKFGIRIENELVCVKDCDNEYGTFLKFDTLTMVPIDRELIDVKYLDAVDIVRINEYHKRVYEMLSPHMEGDELEMLAAATEAF
ncbi:MAG: aminopeptidase P family protein [Lachnospira sp.]|nr:aminopeptidase P family protein [Lachnospira sp.]